MSQLTLTSPQIQLGRFRRVRLAEDMVISDATLGLEFIIPAGFQTDFASIPWWARSYFHPLGRHQLPAVLHDYLYRQRGVIPGVSRTFSRRMSDEFFLEALGVCGVNPTRARVMYAAVRAGGGRYWRKNNG